MIPARGKGVVKTDLSIACPPGTYARVAPRSGLAVKNFIDTGAGVVDEDYRGNVGVVLFNHSDVDFQGATRCAAVLSPLGASVVLVASQARPSPFRASRQLAKEQCRRVCCSSAGQGACLTVWQKACMNKASLPEDCRRKSRLSRWHLPTICPSFPASYTHYTAHLVMRSGRPACPVLWSNHPLHVSPAW